jgi:hypothetical protein
MGYAVVEGFRAVRRSWGLVLFLLAINLASAALLAVPLAGVLEKELEKTEAAPRMLYGFDYGWWSRWSSEQSGWTASFSPQLFGVGFAFSNLDLLLRGELPGRLLARRGPEPGPERPLDPVLLGLGIAYLVLQTFLAGGILGVLRQRQGSWTLRGLLHGAGFYFGRFVRIGLLALAADAVLFGLNAPFARFVDHCALEAVSETTAMVLMFGRHALLLLAILCVHMLSSYAKVIVVLEERSSAVLALLSALSFCIARVARAAGHYLALVAIAVGVLGVWSAVDAAGSVTGYKTQLLALVLMQGFVAIRIALRLSLLGGQVALYRRYR